MRAWVGLPDGSAWASDEHAGSVDQPEELAHEIAARLRAIGAEQLLERAQEMSAGR